MTVNAQTTLPWTFAVGKNKTPRAPPAEKFKYKVPWVIPIRSAIEEIKTMSAVMGLRKDIYPVGMTGVLMTVFVGEITFVGAGVTV